MANIDSLSPPEAVETDGAKRRNRPRNMRAWAYRLSPPWLRRTAGERLVGAAVGLMADLVLDGLGQAVSAPWLLSGHQPPDALPLVGQERSMPRYNADTNDTYRTRLHGAWETWGHGGNEAAIIEQLLAFGVQPDAVQVRFDADTATVTSGAFELSNWMNLVSPTDEKSVQRSANTVITGIARNVARAFSRDGSTWGLLVEPSATNRQGEQDFNNWGAINTPGLTSAATPAGTTEDVRAEDSDGTNFVGLQDLNELGVLGDFTLSCWIGDVTSTQALVKVIEAGGLGSLVSAAHALPAWNYESVTYTGTAPSTDCEVQFLPAASGAADTGSANAWGIQVEDRLYPTSFIGADNATFTREAEKLRIVPLAVSIDGYFDIDLAYRPHYAFDETANDHNLLYWDADNRFFYRASDQKYVLRLGGVNVIESSTQSFARHDEMSFEITHTKGSSRLKITEPGGGVEELFGDAGDALDVSSYEWVYLLGGSSGSEEGSDLRVFDTGLTWQQVNVQVIPAVNSASVPADRHEYAFEHPPTLDLSVNVTFTPSGSSISGSPEIVLNGGSTWADLSIEMPTKAWFDTALNDRGYAEVTNIIDERLICDLDGGDFSSETLDTTIDFTDWSRFVVVIEPPHPWAEHYYGDGAFYDDSDEGLVYGVDMTQGELRSIKAIIRKWKAGHAINPEILIAFGLHYYGEGIEYGDGYLYETDASTVRLPHQT